ncbi:MAG: chromosome segregation protein SMC [Clostridiales bacterium]|nr:chromosome segregation protein SMC [Clostridiales bacterium]
MRIISLELQGFKSFPDKTVIKFDTGVTIIVGPNGSGKSNISDAIRWVLGEISTKNIRGTKMEDVIFGGTDTRRRMGYAEVSLTIDNTDPSNRMAIDYDLVTLTRRYYRTGESEYAINGKSARLKDITEMFMNTGIGRSGYSVIGQGKIAEIISQNGEERRVIFEEAAGIAKYKYKKRESERKLEKTCENLVRVTDILSELEARVVPLEKEASRARTYLDLYEDKKQADVSLWLYDLADTRKQFEEIDAAFTLAKKELELLDGEITSIESQNEALYLHLQQAKGQMDATERRIKEITGQFHEMEASGKVLENDTQHIEAQLKNIAADKQQTEQRLALLREQYAKQNEQQRAEHAALEAQKEAYTQFLENLEFCKEAVYQQERTVEQLAEQYADENNQLVELKATASSRTARPKDEIEKTKQKLHEIEEQIALLEKGAVKAEQTIAEYTHKIQNIKDTSEQTFNAKTLHQTKALKELTDKKTQNGLTMASLSQKLITLKRMTEHFEGYAHSVKAIMDARIPGVHGPVSSIIRTDKQYALAIETALGAQIQNIVVETEETAKKAIEWLKQKGAGRATFFPISTVTASPLHIDRQAVENSQGFIGYANNLLHYDIKYQQIIGNLLGRTVVFDALPNAIAMEKKIGYKIRCVTLDGQIINAGGSFTGGSSRKDSGILSRASMIENMQTELTKLEKDDQRLAEEIKKNEKELQALKTQQEEAEQTISLLMQLKSAEDTQKQVLCAQLSAEEEQHALLRDTILSYETEEQNRAAEQERLQLQIETMEQQANHTKSLFEEAKRVRDQKNADLNESIEQKNQLLLQITAKEKDVLAASVQVSNTEALVTAAKEEQSKWEEQIRTLEDKLTDVQEKIKTNEQVKNQSQLELTELYELSAKAKEENNRLDIQINELRKRFMDQTHERELKFRECTNLENKHTQISAKQESMATKLWDEYELTYSTAAALNYPPVTSDNHAEIAAKVNEYKAKMKALGHVNIGAIEEYTEVKTRYDFLFKQVEDLNESKKDLTNVIHQLESEMRNKFAKAMQEINENFKIVFKDLFGGGQADLVLSDPDNLLESGIEIKAAPPGKIIKNLQLLSGGEQVFVAIALYFAILKVNPTPFCLLDEIEAALDEVNVAKFAQYTKKLAVKTQFIIITHRRGTMDAADSLYGVTMQERGISKILSVDVNEAEKKLGVKLE